MPFELVNDKNQKVDVPVEVKMFYFSMGSLTWILTYILINGLVYLYKHLQWIP